MQPSAMRIQRQQCSTGQVFVALLATSPCSIGVPSMCSDTWMRMCAGLVPQPCACDSGHYLSACLCPV